MSPPAEGRERRRAAGRKKRTAAPLRATEYHFFTSRGRCLLFDVHALTVIRSSPVDQAILQRADGTGTASELITSVARESAADERYVRRRVRLLIRSRFLLPAGETPRLAGLRAPTSYATFMVNVSQRCNLTCPYCYVKRGHFDYLETPAPRMEAATADALIERIHRNFPCFETYGYHFYGGEPLLNFDAIRRIVEAAEIKARETGTGAEYHITTNGTILDPGIADFMARYRFTVYISVDGDRETHDQFRTYANGKGSFGDVVRNLAYLKTLPGVHVIGSSVIRKGLALSQALQMLENHGARQCKAERVRLKDEDALALSGEPHAAYIRDIESLVEHYVDRLEARRKPLDFRLSSKILQLLLRVRRDFFCPAGDRMFGISASGEIYPCALHVGRRQSKLGDLVAGIDPEKQKAFRFRFSWANQRQCQTCWTRYLCGGGCSAMVDRFGHEDCHSLRAESEAAIAVYQHFQETDPVLIYGLVSPMIVRWLRGELEDSEILGSADSAAAQYGGKRRQETLNAAHRLQLVQIHG